MPCGTRVECRRASSGQRAQTSKPLSMTKDIMDSAPEIDRPRDRIPSRASVLSSLSSANLECGRDALCRHLLQNPRLEIPRRHLCPLVLRPHDEVGVFCLHGQVGQRPESAGLQFAFDEIGWQQGKAQTC